MNIATNNLKKDICFCMFAGMKIMMSVGYIKIRRDAE